jgi:hypothetical protein
VAGQPGTGQRGCGLAGESDGNQPLLHGRAAIAGGEQEPAHQQAARLGQQLGAPVGREPGQLGVPVLPGDVDAAGRAITDGGIRRRGRTWHGAGKAAGELVRGVHGALRVHE